MKFIEFVDERSPLEREQARFEKAARRYYTRSKRIGMWSVLLGALLGAAGVASHFRRESEAVTALILAAVLAGVLVERYWWMSKRGIASVVAALQKEEDEIASQVVRK